MDFSQFLDIASILQKFADRFADKAKSFSNYEWGKFLVDSDIAFKKYLEKAYKKYSKVKTILYRYEPKDIYEFYEIPDLVRYKPALKISAKHVADVTAISHFILIQGTGGIGKTTLIRHFFIDELKSKDLIPIVIELKDFNDLPSIISIEDMIFDKLVNLGSTLYKPCLNYALNMGCFLFLFDGYDEILSKKKEMFFKKFDALCDRYPDNYYILTTRPFSDFLELQRFSLLSICKLEKNQAISLISKLDFDEVARDKFLIKLDRSLFDEWGSFASNPLLLNIMFLTFAGCAEIPQKKHLFYENAFETMYSKHDATKGVYRRELQSGLLYDSFKKVFSYFCFISYSEGALKFTSDELKKVFSKIKISNLSFDFKHYIYDLQCALCVLFYDEIEYQFSHRSFQEYFSAFFLKELSDNLLQRFGLDLIKRDQNRAITDSVFDLLYGMAEEKLETNILLPLFNEVEKNELSDFEKMKNYLEAYPLSFFIELKYDKKLKGDCKWVVSKKSSKKDQDNFAFLWNFIERYSDSCEKAITPQNTAKLFREFVNVSAANGSISGTYYGQVMSVEELVNDSNLFHFFSTDSEIKTLFNVMSTKGFLLTKQKQFEFSIENLVTN